MPPLQPRPPARRFFRTEPGLDRFSISTHGTVPEACGLAPSTEVDADLAAILGPGAAVRHPQKASQGRSGTPGAENSARSSGLQRICCILSETHASGAVAQNGGWLTMGGLTEMANQRAPIFPHPAAAAKAVGRSQTSGRRPTVWFNVSHSNWYTGSLSAKRLESNLTLYFGVLGYWV